MKKKFDRENYRHGAVGVWADVCCSALSVKTAYYGLGKGAWMREN
jgi:hypothetical protein